MGLLGSSGQLTIKWDTHSLHFRHMMRTQVYLPENLYKEVAIVAQKEKKAIAQVVQELLADGMRLKRRENGIGKAFLSLAEVKAKGPADLSQTIDVNLYQEWILRSLSIQAELLLPWEQLFHHNI